MADARITRPRRLFIEAIGNNPKILFSSLRDQLVGKGEDKMDLTTLYRMVETFKKQWLIHEISHKGERVIFLTGESYQAGRDAVELTICDNCGHTTALYSPLPANLTSQYTENHKKSCSHCVL